MLNSNKIGFRKLQMDDLSLMHKWLNEQHVHEWYGADGKNTMEEISKKYEASIMGKEPKHCYIVSYERKPVGYIQKYRIDDFPENAEYVESKDKAAGIDLFIGDPNYMGKGLGSLILKKFLKENIFTQEGIDTCVIDPDPDNKRAIRSYEKVGFKYIKILQKPKDRHLTYLMRLKKRDLLETATSLVNDD